VSADPFEPILRYSFYRHCYYRRPTFDHKVKEALTFRLETYWEWRQAWAAKHDALVTEVCDVKRQLRMPHPRKAPEIRKWEYHPTGKLQARRESLRNQLFMMYQILQAGRSRRQGLALLVDANRS
jgi:hypothetical protein